MSGKYSSNVRQASVVTGGTAHAGMFVAIPYGTCHSLYRVLKVDEVKDAKKSIDYDDGEKKVVEIECKMLICTEFAIWQSGSWAFTPTGSRHVAIDVDSERVYEVAYAPSLLVRSSDVAFVARASVKK